ncbi:hypothetical protein ONZ45_g13698 [Pleurotus djamor]|nr:hypothetical protein ONZ45_g13698 [Pleurotus djamor]
MSSNNNNNNNNNNNAGDAGAADASALASLLAALTISPQRNAALIAALRALADSLETSAVNANAGRTRGGARSPPHYSSSPSSVFGPNTSHNDLSGKPAPAVPVGPNASMISVGGCGGGGVAVSPGGGSSNHGTNAIAASAGEGPHNVTATTESYHVPDADETGTIYVITRGRDIGVFIGWDTVSPLVTGVSRAVYFTVDSLEEGHRRMARAIAAGTAVRV